MSTEVATQETRRASLVTRFAERYHIEPSRLLDTLKATAFRQRGDQVVTNEQMAALLIVADQYKLNPFTKEIFAFNDKGAIVPVVSVDGWSRIINEHPAFNGMEFHYSDEMVTMPGGKPCPAWCEVVIYRKDRDRPTIVREYLDEVYQEPRGEKRIPGPWQTHTKRFLRHKTLIQGARLAFGFAGIYDEDEAGRIVDAQVIQPAQVVEPQQQPARQIEQGRSSRLDAIIGKGKQPEPMTLQQHDEDVAASNYGDGEG